MVGFYVRKVQPCSSFFELRTFRTKPVSPAHLQLSNAMTDLELICNWCYFEQICCLLLSWCPRNLEQHSRNKFGLYFVFSEWLLPKDIARVAGKYFMPRVSSLQCALVCPALRHSCLQERDLLHVCVQAMTTHSPACKCQASLKLWPHLFLAFLIDQLHDQGSLKLLKANLVGFENGHWDIPVSTSFFPLVLWKSQMSFSAGDSSGSAFREQNRSLEGQFLHTTTHI